VGVVTTKRNVAELSGELLEAVHQAWQRERRISTHHDRGVRAALLDGADDALEHRRRTTRCGRIARAQQRRDHLAALAIEDDHRMKHVLVVVAVEDGQLLLAVRRVVGAVDVEHDERRRRVERVDVRLLELSAQPVQLASGDGVFQARQGWLGRQRLVPSAARLLKHRIVAQPVSVVAVFVAERDLVDTLAKLLDPVVTPTTGIALVVDQPRERAGQADPVVEVSQEQRSAVG
jgi:hypothetical protein